MTRLGTALDTYNSLDTSQRGFLEQQLTQTIDDVLQRLDAHVDQAITPNHEAKQQLLDELEAVANPYARPYA